MMSESNHNLFGSYEVAQHHWFVLDKHAELLLLAYKILLIKKSDYYDVLAPLLYSIKDSCDSVSFLAQKGKTRDCFVLARTIFETAVNFCFICAKGKDVAERARRHALQKSFRDLFREVDIGNHKLRIEWQGEVDLSTNPELQDALKEFTNKKGREITSWTPETVKEQIDAIDSKFGNRVSGNLQFGLLNIYRHASEIAHGTLFGALFSIGLMSPTGRPKNPQELAIYQGSNISMILLMLIAAINSVLIVLANDLPIKELVDKSEALIDEIRKDGWVRAEDKS
jgi:hypothetical protein